MSRRAQFEEDMANLQKELLKMGALVEEAIAKAVLALARQDRAMAEEVIAGDDAIDALELKIEEECIKLIATQQPLAKDLRRIITFFKLVTNLERMGDYASDIARVTRRIGDEPLVKPLVDIPRMAELIQKMVGNALDAYIKEDINLALSMAADDDEVDHLHGQIFRELLTIMMERPRTITQATHLLFVSRYLERIADHATNLGEEVIFLVTGKKRALND